MARALLKLHTPLDEVGVFVGFDQFSIDFFSGATVIEAVRRLLPSFPLDAENFDSNLLVLVSVLQLLEDRLVVAVCAFDRGGISKEEGCEEQDENPELFHLILLDRVWFHYNPC